MPDASTTPPADPSPAPPPCLFESQVAAVQAAKAQLGAARDRWLASTPGEPVSGYTLTLADGSAATLASLFAGHTDLLIIHNMGRRCRYCSMWADGFIGLARHIERRCAFVLTSPDPAPVLAAFAKDRGWPFRCASIAGTSFAHDLGFEPTPGTYWPGASGFRLQDDGSVVRTGCARFGPGDDFCAAWPLFNLLRGGPAAFEPLP